MPSIAERSWAGSRSASPPSVQPGAQRAQVQQRHDGLHEDVVDAHLAQLLLVGGADLLLGRLALALGIHRRLGHAALPSLA